MGTDALLMPYISSASIACGAHAGSVDTMRETVLLCLQHNVAIGAHPSFEDKANFGRTELYLPEETIYKLVKDQVFRLQEIVNSVGGKLQHVKPHGALYNMAARDEMVANAVAKAVYDSNPSLILYGLSGSVLIETGLRLGLRVAHEAFADRTYQDNGHLTPRNIDGALIQDSNHVIKQCLDLIENESVTTLSGKTIHMKADTICLHGDGPHAVVFAKSLYGALHREGIHIHPIQA